MDTVVLQFGDDETPAHAAAGDGVPSLEGVANLGLAFFDVARARGLSAKYRSLLWASLQKDHSSLLLDSLRVKWQSGTLTAADIEAWQGALWRFANVGHLGKVGGPKAWLEPVTPRSPNSRAMASPLPEEERMATL